MGFANFSISIAYATIISMLNAQLTAVGKMFRDQTTGDFVDQVRYNSNTKRLEYWTGSAWTALDVTGIAAGSAGNSFQLNSQPASYYATASGLSAVADAALPASSYTAADVLAKIVTADGPGSGLDADLLDGQHGAYYLNASNLSSGQVPQLRAPIGSELRRAYTQVAGYQSVAAAAIPFDATTPLVTEGTQILTTTVAAIAAASKIRVRANVFAISSNGTANVTIAVFRDSTCIGCAVLYTDTSRHIWLSPPVDIEISAADTNNHTYSVRVGGSAGETIYLNGNASWNQGGTIVSNLSVNEIIQ